MMDAISSGVRSDGVPPPKYKVSGMRGEGCGVTRDLLQQAPTKRAFRCFVEQSSIEVAVVADGTAERDVNVQTRDWGLGIGD